MNVKYLCPRCAERGHKGSMGTLWAPSGGTSIKCSFHDIRYEQVEDHKGLSFRGSELPRTRGVDTRQVTGVSSKPVEVELNGHLARLRTQYRDLTGFPPEREWDAHTVGLKIEEVEQKRRERIAAKLAAEENKAAGGSPAQKAHREAHAEQLAKGGKRRGELFRRYRELAGRKGHITWTTAHLEEQIARLEKESTNALPVA